MRDVATVGFVMSHACPLQCDFCCHDRETLGPARVSRRMMVQAMRDFGAEPSVHDFAFSGGDPFLYLPEILSAIREVRAAGITKPFRMITSGYWATNGKTRPILEELREAGMHLLSLSYDHEHARWVPPEQIWEICRICADLDIKVQIFGTFWDDREKVQDLLPGIEALAEVSNDIALQAGRARRSGRKALHQRPEHEKYSCGWGGYYQVAIFADGEVYPCCSGDFNRSAELSCGNVNRNSAQEILSSVYSHFHVRVAKELGWGTLYAAIDRHFPALGARLPKFANVDSPCEICRTLNVELKEELAPVYALIEREYAAARSEMAAEGDAAARISVAAE